MKAITSLAIALMAALLPSAAQAAEPAPSGIRAEFQSDMADARHEVRVEMAKARAELDSENLSLNDSLHFGRNAKRKSADKDSLPAAQITPQGDFLVDGKAVAIDARQRQQLLDYRGQIIGLAKVGIDAGEQAAMAALEATDVSLFSLIVGGLSGSLERRVEASVKQHLEPLVVQICGRLPQVLESQQRLATRLPRFQPYANLQREDIHDCERDIRKEFAAR